MRNERLMTILMACGLATAVVAVAGCAREQVLDEDVAATVAPKPVEPVEVAEPSEQYPAATAEPVGWPQAGGGDTATGNPSATHGNMDDPRHRDASGNTVVVVGGGTTVTGAGAAPSGTAAGAATTAPGATAPNVPTALGTTTGISALDQATGVVPRQGTTQPGTDSRVPADRRSDVGAPAGSIGAGGQAGVTGGGAGAVGSPGTAPQPGQTGSSIGAGGQPGVIGGGAGGLPQPGPTGAPAGRAGRGGSGSR